MEEEEARHIEGDSRFKKKQGTRMGDDESMSQTEEVVQSEPTVAEKSENQEQSKEAEGDETLVEKEQVAEEVEVDEGKTKEERQARAAMLKEKGNAKFRSKEYYAAIDFYNQAIEEDPDDGTYYNNRAAAEMAMGFTDKAVESCTKCLELDDGNLKAMIRLGKCYLRLGKAEDALAWFKKALEKDPGNNAVFEEKKQAEILQQRIQRAQEALRDGDFQHALAFAQAGLRQAPDCRELSIIRARGLIASGDYDQAYSLTTKLMRENQNDSELLLYRAKCLYYQENFANAIRHLQNALQLDPDNKEAQNEIRKIRKLERLKETGNVAFKSGRMQEAIDSYSACMEIDPENKLFSSKLYCNRATARQKLKQHEEALEDAEKAIALNPDYGKAYMRKAACLRAIGGKENIEQALHCYSRAEELMGRSAQLNQDVRDTKVELKKAKRKDYYKILDLEKKESSTEAEIKKAYKKKALQWHPDRHAGKTEEEQKKAEAAFKDVGEAYEVLSNPEKRQKYDAGQTLEEIEQGMPNMGHHDPNEIFQMFFGGGMGGGGGFRRGGGGFGGGHPGFGGAYGGAHRGYHDAY